MHEIGPRPASEAAQLERPAHAEGVRGGSHDLRAAAAVDRWSLAPGADLHEVNVAPHNFYGHLCTMMNAHFSAAVPNLRIMETDIDRIAWDHELFTHVPEFVDGCLLYTSDAADE